MQLDKLHINAYSLQIIKTHTNPHEWLFKATWRATALYFRVEAKTLEQAQKRAEGRVLRMEGGVHCMDVSMVRQTR